MEAIIADSSKEEILKKHGFSNLKKR
jgi:hypothetical protein